MTSHPPFLTRSLPTLIPTVVSPQAYCRFHFPYTPFSSLSSEASARPSARLAYGPLNVQKEVNQNPDKPLKYYISVVLWHFLGYFLADLNQHLRLIESARAMSFRKDSPLLNDCFTVMGIFREMSRYRETLEEIVKSCRLTRRQNRPPDANIGQVNLYLSSGKSGSPL
jgi:hypothetical protein